MKEEQMSPALNSLLSHYDPQNSVRHLYSHLYAYKMNAWVKFMNGSQAKIWDIQTESQAKLKIT